MCEPLMSHVGPSWADVCVSMLYTHRHPDPRNSSGAQSIGMRGVNREGLSLSPGHDFLRFPQEIEASGKPPSRFWVWGQLQFLAVT